MGFGDEIIGSGLAAKKVGKTGKRAAFGDRRKIIWSKHAEEIYRNNPKVAPPGSEAHNDLIWIEHYRGHRAYGTSSAGRWHFVDFDCPEGEIYFDSYELAFGAMAKYRQMVVIEPRVKRLGACDGSNKQWPVARYQSVADSLRGDGFQPVQFVPQGEQPLLRDVATIATSSFRKALAVLRHADLYIGPEGGLHHGSAALGVNAVVIWGGFNTPRSTGYKWHHNITRGEPCGRIAACQHCRQAMASITAAEVLAGARNMLVKKMATNA